MRLPKMMSTFITVLIVSKPKIKLGFCTVMIEPLWMLHTTTVRKTMNIWTKECPCISVIMIAIEPKQVESKIPNEEYPKLFLLNS